MSGLNVPAASDHAAPPTVESAEMSADSSRSYLFRGDDQYRGGPVGLPLGDEADEADIQDFADHVLRKESGKSSRYTSFSVELKVARKFTSAGDDRRVSKAELTKLYALETVCVIKTWWPEQVYAALIAGPKKLARQAADVRAAMDKNGEVLIEGQIPNGLLERLN